MLATATVAVSGAEDDAEGCKDSPLITRMPGSTLSYCEHKEFDQLEVVVKGKDSDREDKKLEGEIWASQ